MSCHVNTVVRIERTGKRRWLMWLSPDPGDKHSGPSSISLFHSALLCCSLLLGSILFWQHACCVLLAAAAAAAYLICAHLISNRLHLCILSLLSQPFRHRNRANLRCLLRLDDGLRLCCLLHLLPMPQKEALEGGRCHRRQGIIS